MGKMSREHEIPVVLHRKYNCESLVTMKAEDWIKLNREYEAGEVLGLHKT